MKLYSVLILALVLGLSLLQLTYALGEASQSINAATAGVLTFDCSGTNKVADFSEIAGAFKDVQTGGAVDADAITGLKFDLTACSTYTTPGGDWVLGNLAKFGGV